MEEEEEEELASLPRALALARSSRRVEARGGSFAG